MVDAKDLAAKQASEEKRKQDVADYLQAPRRKRRSYVLVACGKNMPQDVQGGIDQFLKATNKQLAIAHPRTPEELVKQFARQVVLLIYDDDFCDLDRGLAIVSELKRRKNQTTVPVLFLTRDPTRLVEAYNQQLLPFQEADEYVDYSKSPLNHVLSKVKAGVSNKNRRRSRRYKVDMPLSYFVLQKDQLFEGRLVDLSIHGALLRSADGRIFGPNEQLKLHIPVHGILPHADGDYLKISARVRRVFIGGDQVGISFEYMSETQLIRLTSFLTEMVNHQNARKAAALRARSTTR